MIPVVRIAGAVICRGLDLAIANVRKGQFREEDHPRADDGKFGSGGGRGGEGEGKPAAASKPAAGGAIGKARASVLAMRKSEALGPALAGGREAQRILLSDMPLREKAAAIKRLVPSVREALSGQIAAAVRRAVPEAAEAGGLAPERLAGLEKKAGRMAASLARYFGENLKDHLDVLRGRRGEDAALEGASQGVGVNAYEAVIAFRDAFGGLEERHPDVFAVLERHVLGAETAAEVLDLLGQVPWKGDAHYIGPMFVAPLLFTAKSARPPTRSPLICLKKIPCRNVAPNQPPRVGPGTGEE